MRDCERGIICSTNDLVHHVASIKKKLVEEGKAAQEEADQMRFWYRGHACEAWNLLPKGLRSDLVPNPDAIPSMAHEFRAEGTAIHEAPPRHDDLRQWLFLMQHYGLPTLLLDWTRSPLIALYFALKDKAEYQSKDGALWLLRPGVWNRFSYRWENSRPKRDKLFEAYSGALQKHFRANFYPLDDSEKRMQDRVLALEPVYNSPRMISQQSVFTIHGRMLQPMEDWHKMEDQVKEQCLWKFRIPSDKKAPMVKELHDLGVLQSALFPDLDHLSRCIMDRYGIALHGALVDEPESRVRAAPCEPEAPGVSDLTQLYERNNGEATGSSLIG